MAFYMDAKRIPPERLVDRPPQQYDRILQTYDIDGARSKIKNFQPESHNWSLKTDDIKGAKPKKKIRNIWGKYEYNPTDKQLFRKEDLQSSQMNYLSQSPAGVPPGYAATNQRQHQSIDTSQNAQYSAQQQDGMLDQHDAIFKQKKHFEPESQIKAQQLFKPSEALQPYLDYDKVVQPYEKPNRDQQILNQYQQDHSGPQAPKNSDVHNKMENYKQTNDQIRQYDGEKLNNMNQYDKNYQAFYRGYTPTDETQKNYNQTKSMLNQKANQFSSQAQLAQKNLVGQQQQQQQQQPQQPQQQQQFQQPPIEQPQQQQPQQQYQQQQQQYEIPPQPQYSPMQPPKPDNLPPIDPSQLQIDSTSQVYEPKQLQRHHAGSQSVQSLPPKNWQDYNYNLVGGYIQDKRNYQRDQSSVIEKNYYQNYTPQMADQLRRTKQQKNIPFNSEPPKVGLDTKNLDHNDYQYIQEVEKKLNNYQPQYNFGRSGLLDEFMLKPNIASHQRQFIGNTIVQDPKITKPQRYGPHAMKNFSNNVMDN